MWHFLVYHGNVKLSPPKKMIEKKGTFLFVQQTASKFAKQKIESI